MINRIHIKKFELGLRFYRGEFVGLLGPGKHTILNPIGRTEIELLRPAFAPPAILFASYSWYSR